MNRSPRRPPSSYPPETPAPPEVEKNESWDRRLSENDVRWVVGVRNRDSGELAGGTSTQKSRNPTNRYPPSPPRFVPPEDPQTIMHWKLFSLDVSSSGRTHPIFRGGVHPLGVLDGV